MLEYRKHPLGFGKSIYSKRMVKYYNMTWCDVILGDVQTSDDLGDIKTSNSWSNLI